MSRWVDAGPIAALRFAPGAPVSIDGHWIALFPVDDGQGGTRYAAIDNACPHASAPLCDGTLLGNSVACHLHLWEFDLSTGACDVGPEWNVRCYPTRVVDGRIEIDVG